MLEVCVDSVESAIAAFEGGADRIELCGDLPVGGVTPSEVLFRMIRKYTDLKIRVLLRPRFGDFCYSGYELEMMREEVQKFAELGAEGIVTGVLTPEGNLDTEQMEGLISCAGKADVALHRAFGNKNHSYQWTEKFRMGGQSAFKGVAGEEQRQN